MVKPFISNKSSQNNNGKIILRDEENIISEPANVAEIFNRYYSSLAQYKQAYDGLDTTDFVEIIDKHSSHSSVELIKNNITSGGVLDFSAVSVDISHKYIHSLDANKAIGHDGLNAKFSKLCASPYREAILRPFQSMCQLIHVSHRYEAGRNKPNVQEKW